MKNQGRSPKIPLVRAVAWIVGSALVITASGHFFLQNHKKKQMALLHDPQFRITRIVQTGPQKEALSTLCLAEIMGLSFDRPIPLSSFNAAQAERCLTACPVIEKARVVVEKPSTLYIDYNTRQPIAWLYDYVNLGVDEKRCCFPVVPFLSPKNLPEIYLGLFANQAPERPLVWNQPLQDERLELALTILHLFSNKEYSGLFTLRRIDTSSILAESCGQRQIVLMIEETCKRKIGEREAILFQPLFLRLSHQNISQELGNYLSLRQKLWDTVDFTQLAATEKDLEMTLPPRVIDLRIEGLAFIQ
jgi:hypothetical protein